MELFYEEVWALREFVGRGSYPCALTEPSIIVAFYFGLTPLVIRVFLHWRKIEFAKYASEDRFYKVMKNSFLGRNNIVSFSEVVSPGLEKGSSPSDLPTSTALAIQALVSRGTSFTEKRKSLVNANFGAVNAEKSEKSSESPVGLPSSPEVPDGVALTKEEVLKKEQVERKKERWFEIMKFISTDAFGGILFLLASFVFIPVIAVTIEDVANCYGCEDLDDRAGAFTVSAIFVLVFTILTVCILFKIRKEPDPLQRSRELNTTMLVLLIGVIIWVSIDSPDLGNYYRDGKIYWGYLFQLTLAATFFVMVPLQIYNSYHYDSLKNRYKTSSKESFKEFDQEMESDIIRHKFKTYLVTENSIENFYFWAEIKQWKQIYSKLDFIQRNARFKFIHDVFILPKAVLEINIGYKTRSVLMEMAQQIDKSLDVTPTIEIFDEAINEVLQMIVYGPYLRFKETAEYPNSSRLDTEVI